jgi:SNF family Na+-dependent transporter
LIVTVYMSKQRRFHSVHTIIVYSSSSAFFSFCLTWRGTLLCYSSSLASKEQVLESIILVYLRVDCKFGLNVASAGVMRGASFKLQYGTRRLCALE